MRFRFETSEFVCQTFVGLGLILLGCLPANGQCDFQQVNKLLPDDGTESDSFGISVAVSGTATIVGAHGDDDNGKNAGSAYVFDTMTGLQIFKLLPDDGTSGDRFGISVAISVTTAIVGAYLDDDNGSQAGSSYLFDTTTGQQIFKLLPDDPDEDDRFGHSVAISGTTAIVGSWRDDDNGENSGSAYLFDTTTGLQIAKLLPNDGAAEHSFGRCVAISGTIAVIGSPGDNYNGYESGSAYLFDTTTGQQIAKLLPDDGDSDDHFGHSVSINGTTVIVGAWRDEAIRGFWSGSAYLFDITSGQQIAKLLPEGGESLDRFGSSVGINGNTAIIGADEASNGGAGAAYLFDTNTGQQIGKILADDGSADDYFGGSVAIGGDAVIVGAHRDDDNGENSGSAYLFDVVCSQVMTADSFLVTRGSYVSGGVAELAESDNADLSIQRNSSDTQSRTEFEVKAVSPVESPSSMEVTLEGSVFARTQVDQTIELFDYVAGVWEEVDTRVATRFSDSVVTIAATGDLSRFVEAGTMCIQARIRYQSINRRQRFSSNTDQFIWSIGQ